MVQVLKTWTNAGGKTYNYDANGNTTGYTDDQNANERKMLWDEENRLGAVADNGTMQHYIYDAGGQRTIKAKGDNQLVNINGVNTGGKGTADNYTMPVLSLSKHMFSHILPCTTTSTPSTFLWVAKGFLASLASQEHWMI